MAFWLRVAPTFRGLATVFHRRELCEQVELIVTLSPHGKFVALEQRDQPTERGRYPERKSGPRRQRHASLRRW